LLTANTEVNGDSKSTNERGPSLVGLLGLPWRTRDFLTFCPALAALVSSVQNNFFLTMHYFSSCVPMVQQVGQTAELSRLSLGMCHWYLLCQLQDRLCVTIVLSAPTSLPRRNSGQLAYTFITCTLSTAFT
jgi:hypothetical protein